MYNLSNGTMVDTNFSFLSPPWKACTGLRCELSLDIEWKRNIVAQEFKIGVIQQMSDMAFGAGETIIRTKDFMALLDQKIA